MEDLVGVGAHAGPLPRGKDDNGETALVGHGWANAMALGQAPVPRVYQLE
jgi:hypothetical protein